MSASLVMTVIGQDRPGLVESIASIVTEHDGNWLESRMARLGGQFAGILRVQVPKEGETLLVRALKNLEAHGLSIVVNTDREAAAAAEHTAMHLEIVGQDRPGIVRHISRALARHGVNVEELHTECSSAPMSGESLFKAAAELRIPKDCDTAALQKDLEKIAADLMVDVSFDALVPEGKR